MKLVLLTLILVLVLLSVVTGIYLSHQQQLQIARQEFYYSWKYNLTPEDKLQIQREIFLIKAGVKG